MSKKSIIRDFYAANSGGVPLAAVMFPILGAIFGVLAFGTGQFIYSTDGAEDGAEERVKKYNAEVSSLTGMETKVLTLKKSVANAELLLVLDEDDAAMQAKFAKAKQKLGGLEEEFRSGTQDLAFRIMTDKVISERQAYDLITDGIGGQRRLPVPSFAKKGSLSGSYMRECAAGLPTPDVFALGACSKSKEDMALAKGAGGGALGGLALFLGLPFAAAHRRRKNGEQDVKAAILETEKPVTTILKVTYTKKDK